MRNVSDNNCRENKKHTFYIQYIYIYFCENPTVYEIMWKNIVGRCRPQMAIWRMHIVCWIPVATKTNPQNV
jgi:hypothetical protein